MKKIARSVAVLGATLLAALSAAPAYAASQRTWVSGTGTDSGACPITAPCATFAFAITQTNTGGEVNCLTPGSFAGANGFSILQAITIDCHDVFASVLDTTAEGNAITIDAPGAIVTLRNVNLDGAGTAAFGINITAASTVHIEDVTAMNFLSAGINDGRSSGQLLIRNSTFRNDGPAGVQSGGSGTTAVLENVHAVGNVDGVVATGGGNVIVSRSVLSANTGDGVYANSGASVLVDNTEISGNGTGIVAAGVVVLANSDIYFNTTGVSGSGLTASYGNNRILGNTTEGTTPAVGTASTDHGQE
jgi:hypothetical protein